MMAKQFTDILDMVQMDPEARRVFLAMPREEQLLAILGIQQWTRSELATVKKEVIETQANLEEFKRESRKYRAKRERREGMLSDDDTMSTTDKIAQKVNAPWLWFRDKVLPQIVTIATLTLLYFIFGGKLPTP